MNDKDKNTGEPDIRFTVEQPNEGPDAVEVLRSIAKKESEAAKKAVAEGGKHPNGNEADNQENTNEDKAQADKGAMADDLPTLKEAIMEQATESDAPLTSNLTFMKIIGGDILNTSTIRKQIWLLLLITGFIFVYIANRYSCQQYLIEIDQLTKELQDAKYKSLSSNSQITEKSRESQVLRLLRVSNDTTLRMPDQPPYIINVPEE